MRSRVATFLLAAAGLAWSAHAQNIIARLRYEASTDGLNWTNTLPGVATGDTVNIRARVTYARAQPVGGLAQIIFQPLLSGWIPGNPPNPEPVADRLITTTQGSITDTIGPYGGTRTTPIGTVPDAPGVYGRLTPWGAAATSSTSYYKGFVGTGANAGLMRISQAHITNWIGAGPTSGSSTINNVSGRGGVNAAQLAGNLRLPIDPPFQTSLDVVVFKFAIVVGGPLQFRTISVTTPPSAIGRRLVGGLPAEQDCTFYIDMFSTNVLRGDVFVEECNIFINEPAPGSAFALLGAVLLAARRRRPPRP